MVSIQIRSHSGPTFCWSKGFSEVIVDDKICHLKQGKFKLMNKNRFSRDNACHFILQFPVTMHSAIPRFIIIHLFSSSSYQAFTS